MTDGGPGASREGPESLRTWLRERRPAIPEVFLSRLEGEAEGAVSARRLAALGEDAIAGALARPGRDREAAFLLLEGDAFITYACEILAEAREPGEELKRLLKKLGGRFSS